MSLPEIHELLNTAEPAELGPARRPGTLSIPELNARLTGVEEKGKETFELVHSVIFLWHDHLDEAHTLAQDIGTADGSLVHAIMHRREPDYDNAKYWLRRTGNHSCFPRLAEQATTILKDASSKELRQRLLPSNRWDPYAFVDLVEKASGPSGSYAEALRILQKAEFESLLEHLLNAPQRPG